MEDVVFFEEGDYYEELYHTLARKVEEEDWEGLMSEVLTLCEEFLMEYAVALKLLLRESFYSSWE